MNNTKQTHCNECWIDIEADSVKLCSLHAAAPELLEAAKMGLSMIIRLLESESYDLEQEEVRKLQAAIRAAEPQTNQD